MKSYFGYLLFLLCLCHTSALKSRWTVGETIVPGNYITHAVNTSFLILQTDGNLCHYAGSGPADNQGYLWCSGTYDSNASLYDWKVTLNNRGLMCVWKDDSTPWCCAHASGTTSQDYYIQIQNNLAWGVWINSWMNNCRS